MAVLVRDSRQERAAERIAQIVAFWSERLGRKLPTPIVLTGDLGQVGLGLTAADRRWLAATLPGRDPLGGEPFLP